MTGIHQQPDTGASACDGFIHFLGLAVAPASLHVAVKEVVGDGLKHTLRLLGAGSIIEKDEIVLDRGKAGPHLLYREFCHGPNNIPSQHQESRRVAQPRQSAVIVKGFMVLSMGEDR